MDGTRSVETIVAELLLSDFDLDEVLSALNTLEHAGILRESEDSDAALFAQEELKRYTEQIRLWDALVSTVRLHHGTLHLPFVPQGGLSVQALLKRATVAAVGEGQLLGSVVSILAHWGIGRIIGVASDKSTREKIPEHREVIDQINPWVQFDSISVEDFFNTSDLRVSLVVYVPEFFDAALCNRLNESCIANDALFLPYCLDATVVEIGPLVFPRRTACYKCYELRRQGAEVFCSDSRSQMRWSPPIGVEWLCLEIVKALSRFVEPVTREHVWRFNLVTGEVRIHPVLKLPRCPVCGLSRYHPARKLWESI